MLQVFGNYTGTTSHETYSQYDGPILEENVEKAH